MAIERPHAAERETRLEAMMAEFRIARQRRLEKQAIALTNRTTAKLGTADAGVPPAKRH